MKHRISLLASTLALTFAATAMADPVAELTTASGDFAASAHRSGNAFSQAQLRQSRIPNLALGSQVSASSVWSAAYRANQVADGNHQSRWAATSASGQWLQLDLGHAQTLAVLGFNEYQSRISDYTFEYSLDGQQWQIAHTGSKPTSLRDTPTRIELAKPIHARFVKLNINAASDAPSLYEFVAHAPAWPSAPAPAAALISAHADARLATATIAATIDPHDAKFSPATLAFLKANTGLNGEQWDNIMQVVNKPEQDSLDWPRFYGYCENINDNRGYTIGIFGATTGGSNDTGPDGPALFKAFDAASGATSPSIQGGLARAGVHGQMVGSILKITDSASVFCGKIRALQSSSTWRAAMWQTFYNVYIKYSVKQARNRGFTSAVTIGSFVDAALNQGATGDSGSLAGMLSRSGTSSNEKTFLTSFLAQRSKIVDTNDYNQAPNGKNRVKQWSRLLTDGETDLKNADAEIKKVTNWVLQ